MYLFNCLKVDQIFCFFHIIMAFGAGLDSYLILFVSKTNEISFLNPEFSSIYTQLATLHYMYIILHVYYITPTPQPSIKC